MSLFGSSLNFLGRSASSPLFWVGATTFAAFSVLAAPALFFVGVVACLGCMCDDSYRGGYQPRAAYVQSKPWYSSWFGMVSWFDTPVRPYQSSTYVGQPQRPYTEPSVRTQPHRPYSEPSFSTQPQRPYSGFFSGGSQHVSHGGVGQHVSSGPSMGMGQHVSSGPSMGMGQHVGR